MMKRLNLGFAVAALCLGNVVSIRADLTINPTYDSSVTTNMTPADAASMKAAFSYAAQQFENRFSDPITINILVKAAPGTGILGQSQTFLNTGFKYADVRNALIADAKSADDVTSTAHLPLTDPTGGANFVMATAEARALGLLVAVPPSDGTFTFGAGFNYTFDPNHRAVSGAYDFIGVAMHEISEIMGRIPGLGASIAGHPSYMPFDLFRYSGAGTLNLTAGNNIYFSIDGGATNLKDFNFPNGGGSDPQDWNSVTNDAFNAFSSSGVQNELTAVDVRAMDVIGYDLTPTPVPSTLVMSSILFGVFGAVWSCRRLKGTRAAA